MLCSEYVILSHWVVKGDGRTLSLMLSNETILRKEDWVTGTLTV